jgi:hypothetical protein
MTFSFTGLAYLLGFFALGILTYRFFQYWRRDRTIVGELNFYFAAILTFFFFITAIGGLFFAQNTLILKWIVISAVFLQSLAFAILAYLIVYLKLPKISPWVGFWVIFLLGITATILTIITPFYPFLEEGRVINWGSQPAADTLRLLIFLITLIPMMIIFIQEYRATEDLYVKAKALGMSALCFFGLVAGLLDFLLENLLTLGTVSSELALGFLSIFLFIFILLTQKPPPPPYLKKI